MHHEWSSVTEIHACIMSGVVIEIHACIMKLSGECGIVFFKREVEGKSIQSRRTGGQMGDRGVTKVYLDT